MAALANYLHKTGLCDGMCGKTEADCSYAHSVHAWSPKSPNMMCKNGMNCYYKETTCCRIHDGSLADKIRYAKYFNLKFVIPYEPRAAAPVFIPRAAAVHAVPAVSVWGVCRAAAAAAAPKPQEDPLHQLQVEKALIQSDLAQLNIMKKQLEVRILLFKQKASDYWEVGAPEMEF